MHGGSICVRGDVEAHQIGAEVGISEPTDKEWSEIEKYVAKYCTVFGLEKKQVKLLKREKFWRLSAKSKRPYGTMYAY